MIKDACTVQHAMTARGKAEVHRVGMMEEEEADKKQQSHPQARPNIGCFAACAARSQTPRSLTTRGQLPPFNVRLGGFLGR